MKVAGMLVVSLTGCKFQILDSLRQGCSGQNTIFSPKGLF